MPYAKLELLARALAHVRRFDDGRLTLTWLDARRLRGAGAEESYSEGIIDHLRAVEGTKVAALARELLDPAARASARSRCASTDGDARRVGHRPRRRRRRPPPGRRASPRELADDELVAFLREQIAAQL